MFSFFIQAQTPREVPVNTELFQVNRIDKEKQKGYYNTMQMSFIFGSSQSVQRMSYYNSYPTYSIVPVQNFYTHNQLAVAPSFTVSNGYMLNKHWAIGSGMGIEIFDHNLFPLYAEVRYTFWDEKISPIVIMKGGYSFGNFKMKHYEELFTDWGPYFINDAGLRRYGGRMLHPEAGVKVPLNKNCDLLLSTAYRLQKTRSVIRKDYESNQFDEWEHKENLNRLSFGVAVMFR